jgi:hypothetical protein
METCARHGSISKLKTGIKKEAIMELFILGYLTGSLCFALLSYFLLIKFDYTGFEETTLYDSEGKEHKVLKTI